MQKNRVKVGSEQMGCIQHAVWRKRGCNSTERFSGTLTLAPRNNVIVPPACAKPPPRYLQAGDSVGDSVGEWLKIRHVSTMSVEFVTEKQSEQEFRNKQKRLNFCE